MSPSDFNVQQRKSFLSDNLAHFAGARTNPYAIHTAAQICADFKLSVNGQRRLNKALNDLPCVDTFDSRLSFGWSHEHVIRSPSVHTFGYEHLLIVITLSECFHETYAAEVFHHLAKRVLAPEQNTPHIYQWLDLLHFCNGILVSDDFSLIVESFIQLDPYSVTPGGKYAAERCLVPPESVADALLALSELTCGKRESLTLRGGGVLGWLAALAEHFFDLSVTIKSKEHEYLHGPKENAKLNLIYTEKPELNLEDSTMQALTKEVSTISLSPFTQHIHFLPYGGRITWQTLLPKVFGQSFHDVDHKYTKVMYTAIGTAFRAMEDAKDPSSISVKQGPHAQLAFQPEAADAQRLITTLTAYLSSLQHGQGRMEKQLRLTSQDAAKLHLEEMQYLADVCQCTFCNKPSLANRNGAPDLSSVHPNEANKAGYCLPSIVSTIIMIGLMLSRIILDHPINPSREGVQLLYKYRTDKLSRTTDHTHPSTHASPNSIAELYENMSFASTSQILRMAVKFFAGGHMPRLGDDLLPVECVAIAHEGMCAFASELAGGRGVRRDMRGMIRLVNGGFGIRQNSYRLAAWSAKRPVGREGWQWEEVEVEHLRGLGGRLWLK